MTDLLLIGHGSRDPAAAKEFGAMVELVEARLDGRRVAGGFLELSDPPIDAAVDDLVAAGADDVVAVPYVLFGAGHLKDDGPAVLARARRRHPGVRFRLARDLGTHPAVLDVAEERARAVLARLPDGDDAGTAVVLVGRGSTDPDACAEMVKFARLVGDGRGLGLVEAAFVAMTRPSVSEALDRCRRLGARRVAVVPLFLFPGVLVDRIGEQAAAFAAEQRDLTVAVGDPLGPHPRLADLVVERFGEPQTGDVRMNCDVCSYRVRLPGFEERVGTPLSLAPPEPERRTRGWRARRAANQAAAEAAQRRERPRRGLGRRRGLPTPAHDDHAGPAIEVRGLVHRWPDGTDGLAGVDLTVARRERLAVLGANGSGKTTLALHLVGALERDAGSVVVAGRPVVREHLADVRRRVGLVFQDPDDQLLLPTVAGDVALAPANQGLPAAEVEARVVAALDVVGLADAAERAPEHLSLGERRRVALAGVLAAHPEILVLDEPTANLDPAARRDLIEVISGLELTTLVITHDLPLALELCPRSVLVAHGRVAADGPTPALFANPSLLAAHRLELPYRMVAPLPGA
jgi:cobalt/nickel transport system ATP-binding protein